jgi:hypothetical protein
MGNLGAELKDLQASFVRMKDMVSKSQRVPVSSVMKAAADEELKRLRGMETRMKNQMDVQQKQLESLPRAEVAQRRVALAKLTKDFERIRLGLNQLSQDVNRLRVDDAAAAAAESGGGMGKAPAYSGAGGGNRTGNGDTVFRMDGNDGSFSSGNNRSSKGGGRDANGNQVQFQQVMVGQQIDELLAEEREQEILKMNQDLKMVNEMFKDMAEIVQEQGAMVQQVAETTENANSRAKEGLKQVEQAAGYQSSCTIT